MLPAALLALMPPTAMPLPPPPPVMVVVPWGDLLVPWAVRPEGERPYWTYVTVPSEAHRALARRRVLRR